MRSKRPDYSVSHDPKDAPSYDHRLYTIHFPLMGSDLLCIMDDDRTHYPFLKQWQGMEIDINNQWSVNNGTLGLEVVLHKDGKHEMKYMVRVKMQHAKTILNAPLNAIGICDDRKRIILPVSLPNLEDLKQFYKLKLNTDNYIKKNHLSPKGWSIE
jgi:hypothetical protein